MNGFFVVIGVIFLATGIWQLITVIQTRPLRKVTGQRDIIVDGIIDWVERRKQKQ